MAADLTIGTLCDAVRHFLRQIVEHPEQPVDQGRGLVLLGIPGDDEMIALMEAFCGEIKITVREMPKEISIDPLPANPESVILWQPSKETAQV